MRRYSRPYELHRFLRDYKECLHFKMVSLRIRKSLAIHEGKLSKGTI